MIRKWRIASHATEEHEAKLFGGFGIFPFSLVMLLALFPAFAALTTPVDHGLWMELPQGTTLSLLRGADREDALKVSVSRDGKFYFGYAQVTRSELTLDLQNAVANGSPRHAYIRADRNSSYGSVKQALDAIRDAGIEDVSFIATKPTPSSGISSN